MQRRIRPLVIVLQQYNSSLLYVPSSSQLPPPVLASPSHKLKPGTMSWRYFIEEAHPPIAGDNVPNIVTLNRSSGCPNGGQDSCIVFKSAVHTRRQTSH